MAKGQSTRTLFPNDSLVTQATISFRNRIQPTDGELNPSIRAIECKTLFESTDEENEKTVNKFVIAKSQVTPYRAALPTPHRPDKHRSSIRCYGLFKFSFQKRRTIGRDSVLARALASTVPPIANWLLPRNCLTGTKPEGMP